MSPTYGLVLSNLGTPQAPTPEGVRDYLAEFLMDRHVIDLPTVLRWLLVHGVILQTRPRRSARAYRQVWTERGSPLLNWAQALGESLHAELGPQWKVALGMRYGRPSFSDALDELGLGKGQRLERLVVLPLYPQYARATTGSTQEAMQRALELRAPGTPIHWVAPFYANPGWVQAWKDAVAHSAARAVHPQPVYTLFSFHGLPERHLRRSAPQGLKCSGGTCCESATGLRTCYRAQCMASARLLAGALGLAPGRWGVGFQSRLGITKWIGPYTQELLTQLPSSGHRSLRVLAPSFAADCLETIEELGLRAKEDFLKAGGLSFELVSCPNASPAWVKGAAELVRGAV